ncbi:Extracellular solute-binding protein family 1 OS=Tsukamurella paurometabola (strain ATCC 8368 / DSM / CCUG 35730 / CIP 100753 / JCM 10117 / KCTC 9821 /NBRC 16120 / NCIMB 702349 / NCTC 13040) OX=521096 GN=Tpau_2099 PE=4 SV=1 [Tsukamurella paurometabola]|uniref:Extracellular solute-binding protein family 1 n=1 Tax=Tsukamurella paurometabola (strain ATCC 8368 / DSM 20162 / CCUG 35730 / CIP 100753 / JCM 10117 / KCTC 9821 / NBRC 16120 / NCIMB 702349 / NCTC 13040) TaxID=521096 RepID=D5UPF5_TSUPD|nr:2-aminoethylphosphonate ABC transporter substrate-binding protein [Tsukamurella paurometabola]ADG78711.1 extracellular solute-binding protein family 1 [Tsukamurella paurometabola DSM 20162]SUP32841.1 2-aminoethylphosphonate ABC transporter substrate-binding protein [Tsukamurella paurometabola]
MRINRSLTAAVAVATVLAATACGGTGGGSGSGDSVTVYSADGLGDWYKAEFADFTKRTGITVALVEAGSGEVISRAQKEKSNPQVDVLVTLPPFIQQAHQQGSLAPSGVDTGSVPAELKSNDGTYVAVVNNYFAMIRGTAALPKPADWAELTGPAYKQKIQYSTPGKAGDGTALLLLLQQIMGKEGALAYLAELQTNNVGPSTSTGKLGPKVSKGELSVANSDVQMALAAIAADKVAYEVFYPAFGGKRSTLPLPYFMGLAAQAPHAANGTKLMEHLLSKQTQQNIPARAWGAPVRTDVTPSGQQWDAFRAAIDGVEIWYPNWDQVLSGLDADIKAYEKATGQ